MFEKVRILRSYYSLLTLAQITSLWSSGGPAPYDPTNPKLNPLNPQGLKPCI